MKKRIITISLILTLLAGLSLLLYPFVSNWWNDRVHTKAIASYVEAMAEEGNEGKCASMIAAAAAYNETLVGNSFRYQMDEEANKQYMSLLNVTQNGIMSYIEIPAIDATLPIYHGTSEGLLQTGIGHLEGSSLPIGGESIHCVLLGHRGLPSAKLFTNLNKLEVGDKFFIHTLNQLLTYEVDQVLIALPNEIDALDIVQGKNYCTLVTCTPYGVNTHRLLVRGTLVENEKPALYISAEAFEVDSLLIAPLIAIPVLIILLVILLLKPAKKKSTAGGSKDHE